MQERKLQSCRLQVGMVHETKSYPGIFIGRWSALAGDDNGRIRQAGAFDQEVTISYSNVPLVWIVAT